ncbi:MAG: hypothetical protein Q4F84_06830 [Fibrobacter sp.]|nr:hypothetical protein [Fibrobacter sp.]
MRVVVVLVMAFLMVGCSRDNEIKISNMAAGDIYFNFRAKDYHVPGVGGEIKITDIPNGTFDYATTFNIPTGSKFNVDGDAAAGLLSFEKSETHYLLIFSSVYDAENGYTLFVNKTSTLYQNATSVTSP